MVKKDAQKDPTEAQAADPERQAPDTTQREQSAPTRGPAGEVVGERPLSADERRLMHEQDVERGAADVGM